ncbi:glycosyltransferase family 9 protein [Paenalcaligenes sp. Me131]|uniref:glycosyltransferase family 9 protein n=1 Tax=Paenalcaligenes sp. Me131 TaxID=3392636 RepID=UPI003D27611B
MAITEPQTIVVFARNRPFFGAQVTMFAMLWQLKQLYPTATLRVVARTGAFAFLKQLPWVDQVVQADSFRDELAAIDPSCSLMMSLHASSLKHCLLALLRRPAKRLSYGGRFGLDWVWSQCCKLDLSEYRTAGHMALVDLLQPADAYAVSCACLESLANAELRTTLMSQRRLTIMPGAGEGEFKKWGIERFLAAAEACLQRGLIDKVSFVLGPDEHKERERLAQWHLLDHAEIWDKPPLPDLCALVQASVLVLTNDCGPSHIAQGCKVPLVAVFDEAKPEWFWARPNAICLTPEVGQPINTVPVETVVNACCSLLAK